MRRFALPILLVTAVAAAVFFALNQPGAEASPDVTITVNSQGDQVTSADDVLTLREAMMLATGDREVGDLSEAECDQVSDTVYLGSPTNLCVMEPLADPPGPGSADTIDFDPAAFPSGAVNIIWLGSALPTLDTGRDTVDGSSTWDGSQNWVIAQGQGGFDCFDITSDNNTVKGLSIRECTSGVEIHGGAQGNTIGGHAPADGNRIYDNAMYGVLIHGSGTDDNRVEGNYIGTATGSSASPNAAAGVFIVHGQDNVIGGSGPGERNIISGNGAYGVIIEDANGNEVKGNRIGTDRWGTAALPNSVAGVRIGAGAQDNIIGGSNPPERNLISGNGGYGVVVRANGTERNEIKGNYIGTNAAGDVALPNGDGIEITDGAQDNTVEGNVISGNDGNGVCIEGSGTDDNEVDGNYIGTNADGDAAVPNGLRGLFISDGAQSNTVENNVISGNWAVGIHISATGTNGNEVRGNYIGTNANGDAAVPNGPGPGGSVDITAGTRSNILEGNVISGNNDHGVFILGSDNKVKGNYIGTDASGTGALPNTGHGVYILGGAQNNTVGGTATDEGNVIAFNDDEGVRVEDADTTGNTIRGNSIHSNGGKGIELVDGGNTELEPPAIAGVSSVTGTACAGCAIDIYSDDEDEGGVYEGSTTADGDGNWRFSGTPEGPNITATATDSDGNTSEFSEPLEPPWPTPTATATPTATPTPTPSPTATATPSPPVGLTRTLLWGPGWHNETWSGTSTPEEAFACAAGNYAAAYRYVGGGFQRYFPDRLDISNMSDLQPYDTFFILITDDVSCQMPVADPPGTTRTLDWDVGWHNEGWTGADGTDPEDAFACADGSYAAAYRYVDGGLERYFGDRPDISNMEPLDQYDPFLILVTAPVSCTMPIAP